MNSFTVEIVMAPVQGNDWTELRRVTDVLPGTILLEDPEEPMLIIPVDADSQRSAAIFVQGAMSVLGHDVKWGRAYRTERCDLDFGQAHEEPAVEPTISPMWLEDAADTRRVRESVPA